MVGLDEDPRAWSIARCRDLHDQTNHYWRDWTGELKTFPHADAKLKRCAITVHLLAHAPNDAVVAAATTSLPERIGGRPQLRLSLHLGARRFTLRRLSRHDGSTGAKSRRYLDWLCGLDSEVDAPLQVCYRTDGQTKLDEREVEGVAGYLGSQPVRFGNRACEAAPARLARLVRRFARSFFSRRAASGKAEVHRSCCDVRRNMSAKAWREPDCGVWELPVEAHYVASKVMAWVTLDRALRIAETARRSDAGSFGRRPPRIDPRGSARERLERESSTPSASATIPMRSTLRRCSFRSWISCRPTIRACSARSMPSSANWCIDGLRPSLRPVGDAGRRAIAHR